MSSANNSRDDDIGRQDERRRRDDRSHRDERRRSRSRSHSRRHRDDVGRRSHSRSRSRSLDRHRRRRQRTRSRSRSRSRYSNHKSSRRNEPSRSRSRSGQRSHKRSNKHRSASRSPRPSHQRYESKKSRSRSTERHQPNPKTNDDKPDHDSRSMDEDNSSSQYFSSTQDMDTLENLPLPEQTETNSSSYEYFDDSQEPIDKERIHREMEEKLRIALAKEGKVYPPKKPEASHPVFANDGSFLEIFKKMQEAQHSMTAPSATVAPFGITVPSTSSVVHTASIVPTKTAAPPPLVGRRRGGKILKTGVVAKPKVTDSGGDDKDFWSLYLAEVNKYKNNACELNSGNRPLLK